MTKKKPTVEELEARIAALDAKIAENAQKYDALLEKWHEAAEVIALAEENDKAAAARIEELLELVDQQSKAMGSYAKHIADAAELFETTKATRYDDQGRIQAWLARPEVQAARKR